MKVAKEDFIPSQEDYEHEKIGIISAGPEGFDVVWMVRHQVMTRLANRFWTIWLEPARSWRHLRGHVSWPRTVKEPGWRRFLRYFPGFLPVVYRPRFVGRLFDALRLRQAARALRRRGCEQVVLYLWRPEFSHYPALVDADRVVYHIDDEYTFSSQEVDIPLEERQLIESADHVVIHSPALMEKKGAINSATTWVPNGVNFAEFSSPASEPGDLKDIPRPRAGYVGVVKRQMDFEILHFLAKQRPDVSFVLVGPRGALGSDEKTLDDLVNMSNVFELGNKKPNELGAYMQHMDVLMMCYKNDDYTKYIYPLKLHEYLATGRPVIATPIRSVQGFSDVVMLAKNPQEWLRSLDKGLAPESNAAAMRHKRQSTAQEHDWDVLVKKIERIVTDLD